MLPALSLVLGGAASGKSVFAENLLLSSGLKPVYLATARAWDDETKSRIDVHKTRREGLFSTVEAPIDIAAALAEREAGDAVLIDCATMWLTNLMMDEHPIDDAGEQLVAEISAASVPVVLVSNEVGQGIVPDNAMSRQFREAQGRLNIAMAAHANLVVQVVAGLPNVLKGELP